MSSYARNATACQLLSTLMAAKGLKSAYTTLYYVTTLMVTIFIATKYNELKEINKYLQANAEDLSRVKKQRDLLSKTLNDAKKFLGQKRCHERKVTRCTLHTCIFFPLISFTRAYMICLYHSGLKYYLLFTASRWVLI